MLPSHLANMDCRKCFLRVLAAHTLFPSPAQRLSIPTALPSNRPSRGADHAHLNPEASAPFCIITFLEACYGPGGEYCPYDARFLDDWEAGELKTNKDYIEECLRHGKDDLAAQFNFHQGPFYDFEFEFTMPKHPALDPVPVHAWNFSAERPMKMEFFLFGAGRLETRIPTDVLPKRSGMTEDVTFYGLLVESRAVTDAEMETDSAEVLDETVVDTNREETEGDTDVEDVEDYTDDVDEGDEKSEVENESESDDTGYTGRMWAGF